jgi:nitroreductase
MKPSSDTYDAVVGLRVHRNYLSEPIRPEEVDAILEAGRWTGSSKNTQRWVFVVIDEGEGLDALASAGRFTRPVRNAVLAIALAWPPDGNEFDIGRAAQNMMLAAASLGIGSCPITLHDEDRAREVLGLPNGYRCRYAISFGYPDPEAEAAERRDRRSLGKTGRRPLEEIAFRGRFGAGR